MAVLYITEQGAVVRKTSDRLIIQKGGESLGEIPCLKLDTIFLFGNVQVTTQALGELLDHGIGSLAAMVPPHAGFAGRNRRPPRDPMNALLSFGYVLAGNELQALLDGMGFDPYLGFFHQVDYGRPSLALDLLEEFRAPLVDRFCANLLNLGTLTAADFGGTPAEGVLLRRESMKRFFAAWEKELTTPVALEGEELTFRQLFRRQAERLAGALTGGADYESFRWPC